MTRQLWILLFAITSTLLTGGCGELEDRHLDAAYSDEFLNPPPPHIGWDAYRDEIFREISTKGFDVHVGDGGDWGGIVFPHVVFIHEDDAEDWTKMTSILLVDHEVVHVRQRYQWGAEFDTRLIDPRWRWAIEVVACRQVVRDLACRESREAAVQFIENWGLPSLADHGSLGEFEDVSREVLFAEADEWEIGKNPHCRESNRFPTPKEWQ